MAQQGKRAETEREMRTRIADGRYPIGSALPTQRELAYEFGVNPNTVKYVLTQLAAAGLIERQGTPSRAIVTDHGASSAVLAVSDDAITWAQKVGDGSTDRLVSAHEEEAAGVVADRLAVDEQAPVVRRVRHQERGDTLMVMHVQWVARDVVDRVKAETGQALDDVDHPPVDDLFTLFHRSGLQPKELTEVTYARGASEAERELFGMPKGVPLLITSRITVDEHGDPLEYSTMPSRGDLVTVSQTNPINR